MTKSIRQNSTPADLLKHNWGFLLALGILFVILGTIGLGMVVYVTIASMLFFGILLLIASVFQAADVVKHKRWKGALWQALIAALYLIGGLVVIYDPLLASTFITAILAIVLIIIGITRLLMALTLKDFKGWGWVLLAGITALVLGLLILTQWPASGFWFIGLFISIEMIINGWSYVLIALSIRNA